MKNFFKSNILAGLVTILISGTYSCSTSHQPDISGTWYETLQTGQSINGGHIDSATFDTIIYTLAPSGRFNVIWHGMIVGIDSGTYWIKHDSLYFHVDNFRYTNQYYIQSLTATNIVLKTPLIECTEKCDTVIQTDYWHR